MKQYHIPRSDEQYVQLLRPFSRSSEMSSDEPSTKLISATGLIASSHFGQILSLALGSSVSGGLRSN